MLKSKSLGLILLAQLIGFAPLMASAADLAPAPKKKIHRHRNYRYYGDESDPTIATCQLAIDEIRIKTDLPRFDFQANQHGVGYGTLSCQGLNGKVVSGPVRIDVKGFAFGIEDKPLQCTGFVMSVGIKTVERVRARYVAVVSVPSFRAAALGFGGWIDGGLTLHPDGISPTAGVAVCRSGFLHFSIFDADWKIRGINDHHHQVPGEKYHDVISTLISIGGFAIP